VTAETNQAFCPWYGTQRLCCMGHLSDADWAEAFTSLIFYASAARGWTLMWSVSSATHNRDCQSTVPAKTPERPIVSVAETRACILLAKRWGGQIMLRCSHS